MPQVSGISRLSLESVDRENESEVLEILMSERTESFKKCLRRKYLIGENGDYRAVGEVKMTGVELYILDLEEEEIREEESFDDLPEVEEVLDVNLPALKPDYSNSSL